MGFIDCLHFKKNPADPFFRLSQRKVDQQVVCPSRCCNGRSGSIPPGRAYW